MLLEYLDHLGEIIVFPGEDELESLAFNVMQIQKSSRTDITFKL